MSDLLSANLISRLKMLETHYQTLSSKLSDPKVIGNSDEFQKMSKEHAHLSDLMDCFASYEREQKDLEEHYELSKSDDKEMALLAKEEIPELEERLHQLAQKIRVLLLPRDPNDEKNVFLEIRAGTGGEEASLFAAELLRLYLRYAEGKRWRAEIVSKNETGLGGFKEVIVLLEGKDVYSHLRFEGGVHRVQRVPVTETSGRIHTSAVTVAVMPEAEEVEIHIDAKDLQIDVMRAGGPGGQSVNTTDSAVRITHIPTGLVVVCQDEKSQHKNKAKALRVLRARLLEQEQEKAHAEQASQRKAMVGSGDRSERIRTYNFPQNRITDHRIGLTLHKLDQVMEGDLDEIVVALRTQHQAELLKGATA